MAEYLNFHYDPEIFLARWQNETDPVRLALLNSGAVVNDALIADMIKGSGNFYTIPFYSVLAEDDPQNYDGQTDIVPVETSDNAQSGVVFSRAKAWSARDFIQDFHRADPLASITAQVAKWWDKYRQRQMIKLLNGIFGIADDATDHWDEWQKHTTNLAATGSSVTEANKVGAASAAEAIQKAVGDNAGIFSAAVMHSMVAMNLAKLEQLEFLTNNDANGMRRELRLANWNGMTVVVDDRVPVTGSAGASGEMEYTTYLLGTGAIRRASAAVEHPVENNRDPKKNGGQDEVITRVRETIHPNGFTFVPPVGMAASPEDNVLFASANWKIAANPKNIAIARLITNG